MLGREVYKNGCGSLCSFCARMKRGILWVMGWQWPGGSGVIR
jgi:hypothetical protein